MKENFKQVLFKLMNSHSKLAEAEYKRNPGYNNQHFSHEAEEAVIKYLEEIPNVSRDFTEKILEIDEEAYEEYHRYCLSDAIDEDRKERGLHSLNYDEGEEEPWEDPIDIVKRLKEE